MDYVLLQAHIDAFVDSIPEVKMAADGSNASDFVVADVIGGKDFVQNFGGYPRSEIAEINAAATLEMQENLLRKLSDFSPTDNPTAGMTDAQIMLAHKSKYQQAPAEIIEYVEKQVAIRDEQRAEYARRLAAEKADKVPKKVNVKPNIQDNE